ncbi:hypothetical protein ACSX1A_16920 [Pontibacter sp. MBLB2868]|uniref:hypothetical protein n=1 Tax=Pontibacter sp. MBLB2868 TaxID=3451555 RepID=UPI003F7508AE
MKQLLIIALALVLGLGIQSCRNELYKRPVTIDKFEFTNTAGEKYEEQFQKVNKIYVKRIKTFEEEKQAFKIDTTAGKRYRKYNHTLVASLDTLNLNGKAGVYYQLYLRPNSGIGKIKGDVQEDKYNELKLFSPEKLFLQHNEQFYSDSVLTGPLKNVIATTSFLQPSNSDEPGIITMSIDSINFDKGFNKRQREGIIRIINNSIVLEQLRTAGKDPNKYTVFNYYPNYSSKKGKSPAAYTINLNVTQDMLSNKIIVKASSPGYTPDKFTWTESKINRKDYMNGHDYEAKIALRLLAPAFFRSLYHSRQIQSSN